MKPKIIAKINGDRIELYAKYNKNKDYYYIGRVNGEFSTNGMTVDKMFPLIYHVENNHCGVIWVHDIE